MQENQDRVKIRYDGQTQSRAFNEADPAYTRLPLEPSWQPAEVCDSRVWVITLELLDGRVIRRHKDNIPKHPSMTQQYLVAITRLTLPRRPPRLEEIYCSIRNHHLFPLLSNATPRPSREGRPSREVSTIVKLVHIIAPH